MNATTTQISLLLAAALLTGWSGMPLHAETNATPTAAHGTNEPTAGMAKTGAPATNAAPPSASAGRSARLDYAAFQAISERNIFNGSRSGQRAGSARGGSLRRSARVESFTLVGTLISDKGAVAFFDGSAAEYKKALKPGSSLAGFRVRDIVPDGAWIEAGTNVLAMRVGTAMRREEGGPWRRSTDGAAYAGAKTEAASNPAPAETGEVAPEKPAAATAAPSGEMSDVLKRLMEKRQKEEQ
jgi:hypothetical protein